LGEDEGAGWAVGRRTARRGGYLVPGYGFLRFGGGGGVRAGGRGNESVFQTLPTNYSGGAVGRVARKGEDDFQGGKFSKTGQPGVGYAGRWQGPGGGTFGGPAYHPEGVRGEGCGWGGSPLMRRKLGEPFGGDREKSAHTPPGHAPLGILCYGQKNRMAQCQGGRGGHSSGQDPFSGGGNGSRGMLRGAVRKKRGGDGGGANRRAAFPGGLVVGGAGLLDGAFTPYFGQGQRAAMGGTFVICRIPSACSVSKSSKPKRGFGNGIFSRAGRGKSAWGPQHRLSRTRQWFGYCIHWGAGRRAEGGKNVFLQKKTRKKFRNVSSGRGGDGFRGRDFTIFPQGFRQPYDLRERVWSSGGRAGAPEGGRGPRVFTCAKVCSCEKTQRPGTPPFFRFLFFRAPFHTGGDRKQVHGLSRKFQSNVTGPVRGGGGNFPGVFQGVSPTFFIVR